MSPEDRSPLEELVRRIAAFIAAARSPALIEPGEEPIALAEGGYAVEVRRGSVWIEAWSEGRNLVRKAVGWREAPPGVLELEVEKFGRRRGKVSLVDQERPRGAVAGQRARREVFREQFRRMVRRQFPGWRLDELTTGADLEHSLSPAYPRGLLRRAGAAWAAIGAADRSVAGGALSFGILWLDYLRRRRGLCVEGLAVFAPEERFEVTAQRMRFLDPEAAQWKLFVHTNGGREYPVNPMDCGNLESRLEPAGGSSVFGIEELEERLAGIDGAEAVALPGGGRSYRVRGLEFGRAVEGVLWGGVDVKRKVPAARAGELAALAQELSRRRRPGAPDRQHPYYRRRPEAWLESRIRSRVDDLDPTLLRSPVYGQVPALAAGDRDVMDLLALGRDGRLAVIEVKAAADLHLPLQALDYWMRVRRHALRGEFPRRGYFPGLPVRSEAPRLLLVAPALEFHPAVETILGYVSREAPVELIGLAGDWRRRIRVVFRTRGGLAGRA